ncbi:MAG: hypothetical protein IPM48_12300 [Saprospiraceae bacterium]|nr:hypothetical protein [Saprospiraceae bacterium]
MGVRNNIRLIVYRMHVKGLEILTSKGSLSLLEGTHLKTQIPVLNTDHIIQFDTQDQDGMQITNLAIEADWHEIPRVRTMIKEDIKLVKDTIWHMIPEWKDYSYMAAKEALKKALPHEYAALKELKEILIDRNLVKNI